MFIIQGYRGKLGMWKYVVYTAFIFLLLFGNSLFSSGQDTQEIMKSAIKTMGMNLFLAVQLIQFAVLLLFLLVWVKFVHKQPITSLTTSRKHVDWKRIFFMFGLVALYVGSTTIIDYTVNPQDYVWNFKLEPFLIMLGIIVILVPFQTSFEEYLFRGYWMQGLGILSRTKWVPLLITSVLFGLAHINNPEVDKIGNLLMVYYIGTGLFLGIITLMDEGMELALGFHAANNMVTAALVTADYTAFQTHSLLRSVAEPKAGLEILLPIFVIYPLMLGILAKVYGWTNWKEKLLGRVHPPATVVSDTEDIAI